MRRFACAAMIVAACGVVAVSGVPASAATSDSGGLELWSGGFSGQTVSYPSISTACSQLPFVVHADYSQLNAGIEIYQSTNCTGQALTFGPGNINSFLQFDGSSFQATS
jgi:hypothetical protein